PARDEVSIVSRQKGNRRSLAPLGMTTLKIERATRREEQGSMVLLNPVLRGRRHSAPWFQHWRGRGRARAHHGGLHSRSRLQAFPARRRLQEQSRSWRAE